jgi:hypothetical protein
MNIPDRVNAEWIGTLGNDQLVVADMQLHADFHTLETAEKSKSGARYVLLQSPAPLVNAWLRWVVVNNETRARGLVVHHPR